MGGTSLAVPEQPASETEPTGTRAGVGRWRRLHSLTGLAVAGVMLLQLWGLAKVSLAPAALGQVWSQWAAWSQRGWLWGPVAVAGVYHAAYGLWLLPRRLRGSSHARQRARLLQRASAPITLVWLLWPLQALLWPLAIGVWQPRDAAEVTRALLSTTYAGMPLYAFAYLLGLAAAVFHLFNGLWLVAQRWWLPARPRLRAATGVMVAAMGMCVFMVAAHGVIYLASGWRVYPPMVVPAPPRAAGRGPT